jgi:hypothetical protein
MASHYIPVLHWPDGVVGAYDDRVTTIYRYNTEGSPLTANFSIMRSVTSGNIYRIRVVRTDSNSHATYTEPEGTNAGVNN